MVAVVVTKGTTATLLGFLSLSVSLITHCAESQLPWRGPHGDELGPLADSHVSLQSEPPAADKPQVTVSRAHRHLA